MFRLLEKRPFISGLILGFIGTRIVGKRIKRLLPEGITIIQVQVDDAAEVEEKPEEN